jgi:hypothetical protein
MAPLEQALIQNARAYASRHELQLAERLGFGVHRIIFVAGDNLKVGKTAVKAHRSAEPYRRGRDAYARLKEAGVSYILGLNVPQLIHYDDGLQVIEISSKHAC